MIPFPRAHGGLVMNPSLSYLKDGIWKRPSPSINEKLRLGTIICLLTVTGMVIKGRPRRKACCVFRCVCRCVLRAVELPWNIPEVQMRISVVEEEMGKQKAAREECERRAEVQDAQYVIPTNIFLIFWFTIFCMRNIRLAGVITSHNGNRMRHRMPQILDLKSGSSCSGAAGSCLQQWSMMQERVRWGQSFEVEQVCVHLIIISTRNSNTFEGVLVFSCLQTTTPTLLVHKKPPTCN